MSIQVCKKCGSRLNYIDVLEAIGWGYKPLICRSCGAKYNLKTLYILILTLLLSLPMIFVNQIHKLTLTTSLNIPLVVLFYIIYISIIVGLYPFIIKYSFKGYDTLDC